MCGGKMRGCGDGKGKEMREVVGGGRRNERKGRCDGRGNKGMVGWGRMGK